ncbi:hypothetical protein [Sporosarcina sp. P34]|uniref:hypothetical protein n=1 Tax=Sporosarcina sp. P34 TaxID=2048247 RepID=UPI00117D4292|nr:hypothetical protein [Sporosarcina sp. P34]
MKKFVGVDKYYNVSWECVCDCGNTTVVRYPNLHSGIAKSCGCLKRELTIARNTKHGLSGGAGNATRLYRVWLHMRGRCLNEKNESYEYYGKRGISICEEWSDYEAFHNWSMKNGYEDHLTIERIDNDGNYNPENCRWATRKEQARNTRSNPLIIFEGKTQTMPEWAEQLGIEYNTLKMRLHRGWSVERSFTQEVK